ncbi:MAG: aminodeoxychorismate/anthranilate synthase component II [Ferruginibacter sp.]|nr:aminodeoxychorismate/anthranilate synthase component II [Ferruginibacter sp.]
MIKILYLVKIFISDIKLINTLTLFFLKNNLKILVFDNYDSFTYNLVHLVEKITDVKPDVFRNDKIPLEDIVKYDKIILSPGPGIPEEAGLLIPLIKMYAASKSILGVCLGHQAIAQAFDGNILNLDTVFHGVATNIIKTKHQSYLFEGLENIFSAGRYHSWVVNEKTLPKNFEITAVDENNLIMAMQHKTYDLQSVQFHPESVLTPNGETILSNWLRKS